MTKNYYSTPLKTPSMLGSAVGTALFGALIGGTSAAAKGIRDVKAGRATSQEAAMNVAREAGSMAVAGGAAGAVVGALSLGPVLSALGIVAVATGARYAMDSLLPGNTPQPASVAVAPGKAAAAPPAGDVKKKAAPKKTAPKKTATAGAKKPAAQTQTKPDKA